MTAIATASAEPVIVLPAADQDDPQPDYMEAAGILHRAIHANPELLGAVDRMNRGRRRLEEAGAEDTCWTCSVPLVRKAVRDLRRAHDTFVEVQEAIPAADRAIFAYVLTTLCAYLLDDAEALAADVTMAVFRAAADVLCADPA